MRSHHCSRLVLLTLLLAGITGLVPTQGSTTGRCGLVDGVTDGSTSPDWDGDGTPDCRDDQPMTPGNPTAALGGCVYVVDTYEDGDDGECSLDCTLREALGLAADQISCTVQLPEGTYQAHLSSLIIGNGTSLVGAGAGHTLIDSEWGGSAINAFLWSSYENAIVLSGFTLEYEQRGLTHAFQSGNVYLDNVVLRGDPDGSPEEGIYCLGEINADDTHLYLNNTIIRDGGGIVANGGTVIDADYCLITENVGRGVSLGEGNEFPADATFTNCEISYNSGGGFHVAGSPGPSVGQNARLTLVSSQVKGNTAERGAGIYVGDGYGLAGGEVTLTGAVVEGNSATHEGGGIFLQEGGSPSSPGRLTVNGALLVGNTAERGGAIYREHQDSTLEDTLNYCTFRDNTASVSGGAIHMEGGSIAIDHNTMRDNTASVSGGAIHTEGGSLVLTRSTLSGNMAQDGGGIYRQDDGSALELSLKISTLSGNAASLSGGAIYADGGEIAISDSTLTRNTASAGGGIYAGDGQPRLTRTILGDNTASGTGPDCQGTVESDGGFNLVGDLDDCNFLSGSTDLLDLYPGLRRLANSGGPTQTHLPYPGSPVLDKIPSFGDNCGQPDQRGTVRPQGFACDIGAVERQPLDPNAIPPIADGSAGTDPVTLRKLPNGLEIGWGAHCEAGVTAMVVWGLLAEVADYVIADSLCDIPSGEGTATVPLAQVPGDVWFLVLRYDVDFESSWGLSSFGERHGPVASGACGTTSKDPISTCP